MATPHCQLVRALVNATPRRVAPTSRRSAATLPSVELGGDETAGLSPPKIFDVFDAPVRPGESSKQLGRLQAGAGSLTAFASPTTQRRQKSSYHEIWQSHTTLPPPIIFDGPARPPHIPPRILEKHRQSRQRVFSVSAKKMSTAAFSSESEILYEIFDGPCRITRYQYHSKPHDVRLFLIFHASPPLGSHAAITAIIFPPIRWHHSVHIRRRFLAGVPRTIISLTIDRHSIYAA